VLKERVCNSLKICISICASVCKIVFLNIPKVAAINVVTHVNF
jgi:hypothetical protein